MERRPQKSAGKEDPSESVVLTSIALNITLFTIELK